MRASSIRPSTASKLGTFPQMPKGQPAVYCQQSDCRAVATDRPDQGDRMAKQMAGPRRNCRDRGWPGALLLPAQLLLLALSHNNLSGS